jgi:hypothetical protein
VPASTLPEEFEMPTPGADHEVLARLCGDYVGDEMMFASEWCPEQQERRGRISARMLEGFFAVSDYEQRDGEQVTFRGHGVYSWDSAKSCYRMYWFDSMGGSGGLAEGTLDGNVLTFQNTSPMGHHRYRYTFHDDHTLFEMAFSPDGDTWRPQLEARYRPA